MPILDAEGYLHTGDLGYIQDGEVVITGRHKEMILFNDRNIWPQDIENAVVSLTSSVIKRAAAFSLDDKESTQIVVLVEHSLADEEACSRIKPVIAAQLIAKLGISAQIELIPHRSLPFTSSGKLARLAAKKMFISGKWADLAVIKKIHEDLF